MRFFKVFVVLGTCFSFLHHVRSEDFCSQVYGDEVGLHTSYKDGKRSCCKIITCPAGSEAVMCRLDDPSSTDCQPCPPNTFQSDPTNSLDMKYCDAKQTCADGMKVEDDDSKVKDRRCLCDLEKGNCNPSRNRSTYCQRRNCPAGMGLNQDCSCTECADGFFKDVNGSMPCKPWKNCGDEGRKTVAQGTTTTDVVCSNRTDNDNRKRVALPVTTALVTTTLVTTSESISTSDSPSAHSTESSQTSLSLDHTTLQSETSQNWTILVAIATGIIAVLAISVAIFLCLRLKVANRIYGLCKSNKPPAQPHPKDEEFDAFLRHQPNGQIAENQNAEVLPEQVVVQLLNGGNPDHDDLQHQRGVCSDEEDAAAVTVEEDPLADMTRAMKESLRKCRVTLLRNLVIEADLLSVLSINNTITDEMRHIIKKESTPSSKNDKLLDYLPKRSCLSYKTFVFALVCTSQLHLAQLINRELADEYEAYVKSGGSVEEKVLSFGCL